MHIIIAAIIHYKFSKLINELHTGILDKTQYMSAPSAFIEFLFELQNLFYQFLFIRMITNGNKLLDDVIGKLPIKRLTIHTTYIIVQKRLELIAFGE